MLTARSDEVRLVVYQYHSAVFFKAAVDDTLNQHLASAADCTQRESFLTHCIAFL